MNESQLGIIESRFFSFDGLKLDNGHFFGPVTIAYETYGQLNAQCDNAILICHALSGDAHAAGVSAEDGRLGWWEILIGPGKPLDTNQYFFICSNVVGGCKGTTGPSSINPATNHPYALSFPVITVDDMVRAQSYLIKHLGIDRLLAVIGGSMGGMQALSWTIQYPDRVQAAIPIATCARLTAQGIAFNEIMRRAIMADPNFNEGNYYAGARPEKGLAVARMLGHITYLSDRSMSAKFGRRLRQRESYSYSFDIDFEVESYLDYQGKSFNRRFDPNSYLYISRAMDYFDITRGSGNLQAAFTTTKAPFLFISYSSDWLYPTYQTLEMVEALKALDKPVDHLEAQADFGHDSFLLETEQQGTVITNFLLSLNNIKPK